MDRNWFIMISSVYNALVYLLQKGARSAGAFCGHWYNQMLACINNSKYGNNKRTKRKNKRKGFFPACRNPYFFGQCYCTFCIICLVIFGMFFISSPIFRIKFFDFCHKIDPCRIEIEDQKKYGKGTEYYYQNNLKFADRRKRCDCDDNSIQSNDGRPK